MILYLETNGILDLALRQERSARTQELIELTRQGVLGLCVPAMALAESYYPLRERLQVLRDYRGMTNEMTGSMARSQAETYREIVAVGNELENRVGAIIDQERSSLRQCLIQLTDIADDIPLSSAIVRAGIDLMLARDLTEFDAMICASILQHAAGVPANRPKAFLSYDMDLVPVMYTEFRQAGVITFSDAEQCIAYVQHFADQ